MKIMFYVQHLLGIGHLVRASRIASALVSDGQDVTMVTGGMAVDGFPAAQVANVQLPPLRSADDSFSGLADEHGREAGDVYLARRKQALIKAFDEIEPDCLVIEAYPFARRQMRFELLPLLDHVKSLPPGRRPMVVSSIRDILQPKSAKRDEATAGLVDGYFDLVLVHGDERFATLDETFSAAGSIADKIAYTGMIAPDETVPPVADRYDVIVSAGGGAVGEDLLRASLAARELTSLNSAHWLIVTGPNLPDAAVARLQGDASDDVEIVRFRPDLAHLLRQARVSVSQAGYNTVADVLRAKCASVLVPFAAHGEQEQTIRASRLQAAGLAVCMQPGDLSPADLARAIDAACKQDRDYADGMLLDGAVATAGVLRERHEEFKRDQSA
ncbi:glycosyltransferase [Anderseniella sp. Alg231-50]|uniref:glycosyltransferase n=1 Tax=Anderseniella sp. Alg231-50 TaxID=1922226 RepID=UPI000D55C00E